MPALGKKTLIKTLILLIPLFLIQSIYGLEIKDVITKQADALIVQGIEELHDGKYDQCLETLKKVQISLPHHPAGYLFYGAALQWLMVDYRNFTYKDEFMKTISKAIDLAKRMIDENKKDPWGYFYLGGAYGFRGTFHSDFGSILQGFRDGYRGYKNMQKSITLKNDLYDAYYGTGLFHFWKSYYAMKYKVSWLSSGKEEQEQGIRQIKLSMNKGHYGRVEAWSSLIRVLYVLERYQESLELALQLTKKYPKYLYCYWYISKCYAALGNKQKQLETYYWLKNYFEKAPLSGQVALVEIHYYLAKTLKEMGEPQKALEYVRLALAHEEKIDQRTPMQKKYKKLSIKLADEIKGQLK